MDQSQTKLIAQVKLVFLGSQNVLSKKHWENKLSNFATATDSRSWVKDGEMISTPLHEYRLFKKGCVTCCL